ncbi:MAG: TlpA disulfide reductase family protein [Bacteroidia bacterium]
MNKIIFFFLIISANLICASAQTDTSSIASAQKIPAVNIKNLQGKAIITSSFSNDGKPIIIVFWNSVHKFPGRQLDELQENYAEWKKEVKIIVISVDDTRTASHVLPMVNSKGWYFDFFLDINSDFKRAMNINNLPHTFLLNGRGEVVWKTVGFMEGNETLIHDELIKIKN